MNQVLSHPASRLKLLTVSSTSIACKDLYKYVSNCVIANIDVILTGGHVPSDSITEKVAPVVVSTWLLVVTTILAACGIILACFFLAFNIKFRKKRLMVNRWSWYTMSPLHANLCTKVYKF